MDTRSAEHLEKELWKTYDRLQYATKLVGYMIPDEAREWAKSQNLPVHETEFAPPGRLFITGALEVDWEYDMARDKEWIEV